MPTPDVTQTASTTVAATTTDAAHAPRPLPRPGSTEPPTTAATTTTVPPTYTTVTPGSLYSVLAGGGTSGAGGAGGAGQRRGVSDGVDGRRVRIGRCLRPGLVTDRAAIAPVIAWAAICIAEAARTFQLAKWRRNGIIGIAVGAVPFVIALYFFYENVDRLLPAAI